jgi:glyoxylase I family protein
LPEITNIHHVALTVTDAERSADWYQDLLGVQCVLSSYTDEVRVRVLADMASGIRFGVREYPGSEGSRFDEFRTGLDHLAFGVRDRAELEAWQGELERRGIPFSPIAETPMGAVIVFRDPDNIQLEFWLPSG